MRTFLSPKHRIKAEFEDSLYKKLEEKLGVEEMKKQIDDILSALDDKADASSKV
jgi:hypothetical protein